jgi:hypothetical protein
MTVGELFLESLHSGVITQPEIDWLLARQDQLSRPERAAMQRLGRLLDQGAIALGSRLSPQRLHHRQVLNDWIEPLGRRRHGHLAELP